jgi:CheY-like chemotaxis protein
LFFQHGLDAAVGEDGQETIPLSGAFQARVRVLVGEPQDAEARAISLLGVRSRDHDLLDHFPGCRADGAPYLEIEIRRTLVLSTSTIAIEDADLGQHASVPKGVYALLTVADTRHGIPEQVLGRVFEPFFTTKPQERGTGLGLAIAHGIVSHSSGHIRVRSSVGAGTTFSIYLPSAKKLPLEEPKAHPCPLGKSGASCPREGTILVVDDEEVVRTSVRAFLENEGLAVVSTGDAHEAVKIALGLQSRLVLLITDVVMPTMTGTELAKSLLTGMPGIPIIFMSGYAAGKEGHDQFKQAKFLQKPFSRAALLDTVCEGLRTCPRAGQAQD